jgi:sensor histidine kinase YesM
MKGSLFSRFQKIKKAFAMKNFIFFLFFLSLTNVVIYAQSPFDVTLTQNPPNLKWRQMNSEHFQLIFDAQYEKQAPAVMQALEATYLANGHGIKVNPKKIPIIMQTQNIQSNGFVEPINFRSEFFLTPPQGGFGSTSWMQTLADRSICQRKTTGRKVVSLSLG